MRLILSIAVLAVAGCTTAPTKPVMPQTVQVVVTRYIPVPDALTAPCTIAQLTTGTGFDALAVGHARGVSLADCNRRIRAIRDLHP
jgi:hypothetical protein